MRRGMFIASDWALRTLLGTRPEIGRQILRDYQGRFNISMLGAAQALRQMAEAGRAAGEAAIAFRRRLIKYGDMQILAALAPEHESGVGS